jgi:hypothetical protein
MQEEETQGKGDKAQTAGFGCFPMGQGMVEMMSRCCAGQGEFPDCSAMMKNMMEAAKNQPCCTPKKRG